MVRAGKWRVRRSIQKKGNKKKRTGACGGGGAVWGGEVEEDPQSVMGRQGWMLWGPSYTALQGVGHSREVLFKAHFILFFKKCIYFN